MEISPNVYLKVSIKVHDFHYHVKKYTSCYKSCVPLTASTCLNCKLIYFYPGHLNNYGVFIYFFESCFFLVNCRERAETTQWIQLLVPSLLSAKSYKAGQTRNVLYPPSWDSTLYLSYNGCTKNISVEQFISLWKVERQRFPITDVTSNQTAEVGLLTMLRF